MRGLYYYLLGIHAGPNAGCPQVSTDA